jgi:ribosomal protein S18 acetylase RimI-like enzyme
LSADPSADAVVRISEDRADEAAGIIVRAFAADPSVEVAFPEPSTREEACRITYLMLARLAVRHGQVLATPDPIRAVAIWTPPEAAGADGTEMAAAGMTDLRALLSPEGWSAMRDFVGRINALHEQIAPDPHWHLDFLATDPQHQGQGLGGSLVAGIHAIADRDGLPCALETLTPSNVTFYERRGYRVVEEATLPGTHHRMWGMRREPAAGLR